MSLADTIRARFEDGAGRPPPLTGDQNLPTGVTPVPAAVLVALVDRPEPTMLLTRRNEALRKHPGQIAFAGGRADPEDAGPIATALREAEEEVGMPPSAVHVIGRDHAYVTGTGFSIVPVIGIVPPDLPLMPREFEVADIFEVPMAFALERANQVRKSAEFSGTTRHFYEILWQEWRIWGATAAMIVNLSRWMRG
jgi:8-oxo-dGTP pyrophosphatase MutT (NUDIX family)